MKVQMDGMTIAYEDCGRGFPILFLHAFPLSRRMWDRQQEALAGSFRIVTMDLRGHGESDAPLWHYTLEQSADDAAALLDHLSIREAVVCGLSMGGYIAFALYRKYRSRVAGLVLADTKAGPDTPEGRAGRFHMAQTVYRNGPPAVAGLMLPKLLSPATIETRPDLVRFVGTMIEGNEMAGIAGNLMAMAERPDSTPLLSGMACPVQLIVGELDLPTPPAEAQFMADRIAGARMAVIPGAAHLSNLEQPDAFNDIVRTFVSGLTGGRNR